MMSVAWKVGHEIYNMLDYRNTHASIMWAAINAKATGPDPNEEMSGFAEGDSLMARGKTPSIAFAYLIWSADDCWI